MSLVPFIYIACSEQRTEPYSCSNFVGDAMPLFPIPPSNTRISNFNDIITSSIIELQSIPQTNTRYGTRSEYQYILKLSNVDEALREEHRKIYAMCSGEIRFHNTQKLIDGGWDINAIFKNGKTAEAIELRPMPQNWNTYYPGYLSALQVVFFYFNFVTTEKESYLRPLIDCHVTENHAKKVVGIGPLPEGWQDQYYQSFLNQNATIPVNAGEVIGKADHHVDSASDIYRLSMHYLFNDTLLDYAANLEGFFKCRGRLPTIWVAGNPGVDSMAGHPVGHLHTNVTVQESRVDFVDQTYFATKATGSLGLDLEQYPAALAYKRMPSESQQTKLLGLGITQQEFEEAKFTIYNPDDCALDVRADTTDPPLNDILITPSHIDSTTKQQEVKVVIPPSVTSATLGVYGENLGAAAIHSIVVSFFDCVIVPVKFWKLRYVKVEANGNKTEITRAADVNVVEVLKGVGRILGNQTNVYMNAIAPAVRLGFIDITTQSHDEEVFFNKHRSHIFDRYDSKHHEEIQKQFTAKSAPELNVIWTWDIMGTGANQLGNTAESSILRHFPYPYIFVEVGTTLTDSDRGCVVAHEYGHWLYQRNINDMSTEEMSHFDHNPRIDSGDDRFGFNLLQPNYAKENECITIRQAQIYNQYSRKVAGADPHI